MFYVAQCNSSMLVYRVSASDQAVVAYLLFMLGAYLILFSNSSSV